MTKGRLHFTSLATLLLFTMLFSSSCNVFKTIPEGQHLLDKNIIKTDRSEYNESVVAIFKQKPNRKILGIFRFHLGVYNLATLGKETKFKKWVKEAIGEEPILLDTNLTFKSREQVKILFQNNGYFNASVIDSTVYKRKKARVYYKIKSGEPYKIRNIKYEIKDPSIRELILDDPTPSLIASGKNFSNTLLQNELNRVSVRLRNLGYFNFSAQYIYFDIDSSLNSNQVDLWMVVTNPQTRVKDSVQTIEREIHQKSYVKEIFVEVDYDPILTTSNNEKDTTYIENMVFISRGKLQYSQNAKHLVEHIFIKKDSLYSQENFDLTYRRLSDLGIFRFINIRSEILEFNPSDSLVPLRCYILLSPQPRQEFKAEAEGTNNGGNFGIAGNLVYRNKNIFKGAETFTFKIKGGLEIQQNFGDTTYEATQQLALFNAYEIGPEFTLTFPRGLWPFNITNPKKVSNPSTSISASFNTQNRPEYYRQLVNLSYFYTKKTTPYNRFYFYPAEINYLNVKLDPAFQLQLEKLQDPTIILGYSNQFIADGRISYLFNNQELGNRNKYFFFRANLEFAGNSIYLAKRIGGENIIDTLPSELFNVKFAQYFRPDFDLRFYKPVNFSNALAVFRIAMGFGLAYGNSIKLPFEKSFYAGGPNDIRAWRTRNLGPGSNTKEDYFERFGDLKITTNLEYRFDIYRKLKGATFIDAGNIWLWKSFNNSTIGVFNTNTFMDQIAIGAGVGIRFDFTFFILRLDGAIQVRDPKQKLDERWVLGSKSFSDITYNFGIGYPF
jgi:outer membrane protein assembly factor BamA